MEKPQRPSKVDYYIGIAKEVANRGTCYRLRGGAIIVKNDQIISTGYIGAPRKTKDCLERGNCLREEMKIPHGERYEMCRSVHAEQNAIINAARAGVRLLGGNMYLYGERPNTHEQVDMIPCYFCKRMVINAGIETVFTTMRDGSVKEFFVAEWIRDWRENDIVDDKYKYGADSNKSLNLD